MLDWILLIVNVLFQVFVVSIIVNACVLTRKRKGKIPRGVAG